MIVGLLKIYSVFARARARYFTSQKNSQVSIKDTCLSVCRLSSVRFPLFIRPCSAGREATLLHAREHAQSWCMISYVDICTPARCHVYMWVMLATVTFKLLRKSECVPQFYVRRTFFTHVHGFKSSHLETQQLLDLQRLQSWLFMQAQSCRLRHLNGESFRSVRQVTSCCFTPRNYFSLSESDGGLICSSNRVHGPRNCSQEGSQTASRFAIQVDRDGR